MFVKRNKTFSGGKEAKLLASLW